MLGGSPVVSSAQQPECEYDDGRANEDEGECHESWTLPSVGVEVSVHEFSHKAHVRVFKVAPCSKMERHSNEGEAHNEQESKEVAHSGHSTLPVAA